MGDNDSSYRRLDGGGATPTPQPKQQQPQQPPSSSLLLEEGDASLVEEAMGASRQHGGHQVQVHVTRIPPRYVKGCNGDMEEAARRWKETLAW